LQQLTFLDLCDSLWVDAPAAAYAALTASSKLQHLEVGSAILPAAVWQHVFPSGRRLPHLRVLDIEYARARSAWAAAAAPDGNRLVSCCPGLQSLNIGELQYSADHLAALTGLSDLHQLTLCPGDRSPEGLEVVCQLTGLRRLYLRDWEEPDGLLLLLTQLRQLTQLAFQGYVDRRFAFELFKVQVGDSRWFGCVLY
jgi:hypothetical protein